MATELRFRQVHLDYHTSPDIPGIGSEFDAEQFTQTLEQARVDSITCFARCTMACFITILKRIQSAFTPISRIRIC